MDRPHLEKVKRKHHLTGSDMEPIRKTKPWKTRVYLEKRDGGRDGGRRLRYSLKNWRRWPKIVLDGSQLLMPDGLCSATGKEGDDDDHDNNIPSSSLHIFAPSQSLSSSSSSSSSLLSSPVHQHYIIIIIIISIFTIIIIITPPSSFLVDWHDLTPLISKSLTDNCQLVWN